VSQHLQPLASAGVLHVPLPEEGRTVALRIARAHLEEDSGKLVHLGAAGALAGATASLADYNRAGAPLLEVVSLPDLRGGREAAAAAAELQRLVRWLGCGDGNMAEGSLRVDVNVSVRRRGAAALGTKVEVKNLNSFANVARAVDFEHRRQAGQLAAAQPVAQETRLWEEAGARSVSMRAKEGLADYRHVWEPDLARLALGAAAAELPELPHQARARLQQLGLAAKEACLLADSRESARFFDACCAAGAPPAAAARWQLGDVAALLAKDKRGSVAESALQPAALAELLAEVAGGRISGKARATARARAALTRAQMAKEALPLLMRRGGSAAAALAEAAGGDGGAAQISDEAALEELVRGVLADSAQQVAEFRAGKEKLKGFFLGAVMKRSGGRANPGRSEEILMRLLSGS